MSDAAVCEFNLVLTLAHDTHRFLVYADGRVVIQSLYDGEWCDSMSTTLPTNGEPLVIVRGNPYAEMLESDLDGGVRHHAECDETSREWWTDTKDGWEYCTGCGVDREPVS